MSANALFKIFNLVQNEINARDEIGNTPLILAACKGHADVVKILEGANTITPEKLVAFINRRHTPPAPSK